MRLENVQRVIWIDAISINQANIAECNREVPLMTEVYRKSLCNLVHVADDAPLAQRAQNCIQSMVGIARQEISDRPDKLDARTQLVTKPLPKAIVEAMDLVALQDLWSQRVFT